MANRIGRILVLPLKKPFECDKIYIMTERVYWSCLILATILAAGRMHQLHFLLVIDKYLGGIIMELQLANNLRNLLRNYIKEHNQKIRTIAKIQGHEYHVLNCEIYSGFAGMNISHNELFREIRQDGRYRKDNKMSTFNIYEYFDFDTLIAYNAFLERLLDFKIGAYMSQTIIQDRLNNMRFWLRDNQDQFEADYRSPVRLLRDSFGRPKPERTKGVDYNAYMDLKSALNKYNNPTKTEQTNTTNISNATEKPHPTAVVVDGNRYPVDDSGQLHIF